jgi:hypothetical protein
MEDKMNSFQQARAKTAAVPKKLFAVYSGPHTRLRMTPHIGLVVAGTEYEVPKAMADALRREPDWKIIER